MITKALTLLCLLAAAVCQNGENNGDLESIIGQIFGTPPPGSVTQAPVDNKHSESSTLVPGVVTPSPIDDKNKEYLDSVVDLIYEASSITQAITAHQKKDDFDSIVNQIFGASSTTHLTTKDIVSKAPIYIDEIYGQTTPQKKDDIDSIINQIFGASSTTQATTKDIGSYIYEVFGPSTSKITTDTSETLAIVTDLFMIDSIVGAMPVPVLVSPPQDLSCTTPDQQVGECVPYYLCNIVNNTVNTDGEGVIDIRFRDGPCVSYLDTCCLVPDKAEKPVTPKPEPKREGCGWRNPKGVGIRTTGDVDGETKFGEFPWTCAILRIEPVNDNEPEGQKLNVYVGGGSLIHPSVVLTAAHYVVGAPQLRVRAGEWDTQSIKEPHPYQDREVEKIESHQDFNKGNLFYDIALLFLSQPMELAPNVALACLPPPRERVPAGTRCFATGWGKDKFGKEGRYQVILKKVEVPVVDRNTCQAQLRKTRLGKYFELHTSFMCAGGEPGKDTCKGDGGSPLSCPIELEEGRYMQSGIVAWGIGCGEDATPGVYVDVANLRSWVDDKIAGKGHDPKTYSF